MKGKNKKINSFIVLYEENNDLWIEVGRTEIVINDNNPEFETNFPFNYNFGIIQNIKFDIYSCSDDNIEKNKVISFY